ncbi:PilZ domain-containing protein [Methylobacterium dankookense]|uniref:PilZ domain-containing protein n=1 Tax=Methylobacterium dankookense TaxID=560405 RepID=A0A564FS54_9HYPH|nr:hypothetical protein IFDJLNFL_4875 [Methylobacterium dankookense]VUF10574.1 hypothetical protein MTDSW087_00242 [Methylobacterium dankookense]
MGGSTNKDTLKGDSPGRRAHDRFAVMIPAAVILPDGVVVACVIRDISVMGARLSIARRHRLESTFPLRVASFAEPFPMRRIWQQGDFAGAMLDLPATEETVAGTHLAIAPPTSPSPPGHRPSGAGR